MPTIKEYTSSIDKLTPDERGYTAWETAGRRIGPLYNQAASDIERGGKLDAQMIEQADKLHAHELDYLGLLGKQQARAGGGGGGGGGSHSGGGSQPSQQQPLRTYNPGPSIANAAANLTGAAAAITGHQEGRGIYAPEDPLKGGYYEPEVFRKLINDLSGTDPEKVQQQEMDRLDAQNEDTRTKGQYTTDQFGQLLNTLAPDKGGFFSNIGSTLAGFTDTVSSTLRSLAYGGTDSGAAPIVDQAQAAQDDAGSGF